MCVTFTGCELLCSETVSRQQLSHATLKPKLQVQIKMMVMKDKNAKACRGFVWIKPMGDWDWARGYLVFPAGEEGHDPPPRRLLERRPRLGHLPQPHVQAEAGMGPGAAATHSPLLGRRGVWGLRQMDLKATESPGGYAIMVGKSHQPRGFLPQGRRKVVPMFAIELNWNKDKAGRQC